jgi:DNA (cytosine-5)-methyltransferase 1
MKTYKQILDSAWQAHLISKSASAPTMISLFAGCGGSSLGFSIAGYKELLAVEWDEHAVHHFRLNFPHIEVYHGDVASLSVSDCELRLKGKELSLLDGSPPCQGFSTSGKRNIEDPRNSLFREYVRLLRGLRPRAFVMENVSGMIKGKMRIVFAEILKELKDSGYNVLVGLFDASTFGVPQRRQRVIFIGARNDLNIIPTFPKPFNYTVNAEQACYGASTEGAPLLSDGYGKLWKDIPRGRNAAFILNGKGFNGCVKIDPFRPAPTIPKMQGGHGFGTMVHWRFPRALSIGEAKRLEQRSAVHVGPGQPEQHASLEVDLTGLGHLLE